MTDIILGIGVAAFIVYTAFHISYIVSIKRTSERMGEFFQNTEGSLNAALAELKDTLENVKKITGDVSVVTDEVRQITSAVAGVERTMRGLFAYVKEGLGPAAGANMAGLKAGITTGVATLVRSLHEGRRDDHEGGT